MVLAHKKLIREKLVKEEVEQNVKQEAKKKKYLVKSMYIRLHCSRATATLRVRLIEEV